VCVCVTVAVVGVVDVEEVIICRSSSGSGGSDIRNDGISSSICFGSSTGFKVFGKSCSRKQMCVCACVCVCVCVCVSYMFTHTLSQIPNTHTHDVDHKLKKAYCLPKVCVCVCVCRC
jgi:hypothetical protein